MLRGEHSHLPKQLVHRQVRVVENLEFLLGYARMVEYNRRKFVKEDDLESCSIVIAMFRARSDHELRYLPHHHRGNDPCLGGLGFLLWESYSLLD